MADGCPKTLPLAGESAGREDADSVGFGVVILNSGQEHVRGPANSAYGELLDHRVEVRASLADDLRPAAEYLLSRRAGHRVAHEPAGRHNEGRLNHFVAGESWWPWRARWPDLVPVNCYLVRVACAQRRP